MPATSWAEEPVTFENWEAEGCHVFADNKHVLTLNTPELISRRHPSNLFLEDWISPEEFCESLEKVLRALGASPRVIASVENERQNYQVRALPPPTRTKAMLLAEVEAAFH